MRRFISFLLSLMIGVKVFGADAREPSPAVLGVIVHRPDLMTEEHWRALRNVQAVPELLARHAASDPSQDFSFEAFEKDLEAFHQRGFFPLHVTLTPHVQTVARRPQKDADGTTYSERHNPFDPDFLAEWKRLIHEFCGRYRDDPRIGRLYIAPPSYFGEAEYYMGPNWADLRMLCYGDLARERFLEWLKGRYGSPRAAAAAWNARFDTWDGMQLPQPCATDEDCLLSNAWLDLTQWRTEYLTAFLGQRMKQAAAEFDGEVAVKVSAGDYSAVWATDSAALVAECGIGDELVLHMTNAHSLSDLKYGASIASRYHVSRFVTENDGNRFSRTEIAKIVLNSLLAGVDEFNFSQFGHLVGSIQGYRMTDSGRALEEAGRILLSCETDPPRNPVAFLHSTTTCRVRPPLYRNRDVSHVYDTALSNGANPDVRAFDWARYLHLPDVTGESLILDGDLAGRRMLIIPSTRNTFLRESVLQEILDWVEEGGVFVVFGADALGSVLLNDPPAPGKNRTASGHRWEFPAVSISEGTILPAPECPRKIREFLDLAKTPPAPVWRGPLPVDWVPYFVDLEGHCALAAVVRGSGRIVLLPASVPEKRRSPADEFYARSVPLILRHLAENEGIRFPYTFYEAENPGSGIVAPIVLGSLGSDAQSGRYLFVGGAYDRSVKQVRFVPDPSLSGPGRLLLVDTDCVDAKPATPGTPIQVTLSRPPQSHLYQDPTNLEPKSLSLIPITTIDFELPSPVVLTLSP
jgi:hypothetical protein